MSNTRFLISIIVGGLIGWIGMGICKEYDIDFGTSLILIILSSAGANTIVQMLLPQNIQ